MRLSVLATSLCLLCCIPQDGLCLSQAAKDEFLHRVIMNDPDDWIDQIETLSEQVNKAKDPLAECRQFVLSLLQGANSRYMGEITLEEGCQLVNEKLDTFPKVIRKRLKKALALLSDPQSTMPRIAGSAGFDNRWAIVILFAILCVVVFVIAVLNPAISGSIVTALTSASAVFVKQLL